MITVTRYYMRTYLVYAPVDVAPMHYGCMTIYYYDYNTACCSSQGLPPIVHGVGLASKPTVCHPAGAWIHLRRSESSLASTLPIDTCNKQ